MENNLSDLKSLFVYITKKAVVKCRTVENVENITNERQESTN